ncbi:MAG TPA: signal peptidase II [Actinomycetaceae bacterium]|nr:signal peptidase II [Actinomycetaceae bacterium]
MTQQGRRRRIVLLLWLAAGIAVVDQVTKYLAEARLTPGVVNPLLGDLLGLQLIYNPGAAFSLATGMTWIFTVITVAVVVYVLRVARRLYSTPWAVALGLLLGGALGNLYDRLLREPGFGRGHVVDFINYNGWFVGNVADIAIVAAAVLIAVLALRGVEVDGTRTAPPADGAAAGEDPAPAVPDEVDDLGEEPLTEVEEFSPEVPRPTGAAVDIAAWVRAAPSASRVQAGSAPVVRADDEAAAEVPGGPAGPADPGTPAGTAGPAGPEMPAPPATPAGSDHAAGPDAAAGSDHPACPDAAAGPDAPADPDAAAPPATGPTARWSRRPRTRREARLAERTDDDG